MHEQGNASLSSLEWLCLSTYPDWSGSIKQALYFR
jgi:hypothetical protein